VTWACTIALAAPPPAVAISVTDAGVGFPLSVNPSDHILIGKLVLEEEEGTKEEDLAGPWSIWADGSSTPLEPLNGGPETTGTALGEPEHTLFLYRLNAAGVAGGTSTISYLKEGKEKTVHRAVFYTPDGVGHEVPPLSETILNDKGEPVVVGAFGTGIDEAGDVAGLGVVKAGEHPRARGFFSAGGTAHPSVVGEADGPWTEVLSMNEAGTMFGTVSEMKITETEEGKTEEEPINPKYVLWKTPGGSATVLNFDSALVGFPLANDGSAIGYVSGKLMLRAPGGSETEVAGLSKPFAVNASHQVVGSKRVGGVEHAAVWQAGTVTDLNTLLPKGSGWVLSRAVAINDRGDVAGVGLHEGKERVFLIRPEVGEESSISGAPSVALPEEGTTTEEFTVSLSEPSAETVTVGYETEDGTATVEHDDYTEESGTLTFAPGETSKPIDVQINDGDGEDEEASETYKVRLTGTATTTPAVGTGTATGTVGLPGIAGKLVSGPASGAASPLSPAAGISVQIKGKTATGGSVEQTVTSDAAGNYKASVDAGTYSVTATGVPAGQPAGFTWSPTAKCPGKRKEATCEAVPVKAANATTVQPEVGFGYGQRDPQVENVEVLQAVQLKKWDKTGPDVTLPTIGKASSFEYDGVGLAGNSSTVVRVYVSNNGAGSAQELTARLNGYSVDSAGTFTALPGGPLTPLDGPLDGVPTPAVEEERTDAGATFNFQLPLSWTKGKIVLAATVDPEQKFPECAGCRANDNLALTGISFTEVPALKFTPAAIEWKEGTTTIAPANPTAAVTRTWPYWPLPTGGLEASGPLLHVDITEALAQVAKQLKRMPAYRTGPLGYKTESLVGCLGWGNGNNEGCVNLLEAKLYAAEKTANGTGTAPVVGVYNDTGFTYGVLGAANNIPGKFSYVPDSPGRSEVVVHEMLHQLGFKHSGCTGPEDEEPWPANAMGQASLIGFGEDRSLKSVGGIGPILSTTGKGQAQGSHDIMSYCFPDWPSTFNWDRLLEKLAKGTEPQPFASIPRYKGLTATTASAGPAGGATVTVDAIDIKGSPVIASVEPGAQAEAGESPTPYTAEALDARGHVITKVAVRAVHTHADVFSPNPMPDEQTIMHIQLPARGLAGIAILQGKHVLTTARAPKGRLRMSVAPISRAACRRRGPLKLRYRVQPRGGLYSSVRVLAVTGHRSKTIEIGAGRSVVSLPAGARPKRATKLLVEFTNGFAAVSRTVKIPKGCRAG